MVDLHELKPLDRPQRAAHPAMTASAVQRPVLPPTKQAPNNSPVFALGSVAFRKMAHETG